MRVVIIAHGSMNNYQAVRALISSEDFIIAADGGALHAQALQVKPHILLGDMDSLGEEKASELASEGVKVIYYPKEKDKSDTHIALDYALSLQAEHVIILGGMGTRMDHTLANLLLCFHEDFKTTNITIKDENQDILRLNNNTVIYGKKGETFSLIALEDIEGLSISGAKYPLNKVPLTFGASLTISNEFLDNKVCLSWEKGEKLLLIRQRN